MNSSELKMAGLCWLRYTKQFSYLATEVGRWHADVFGCSRERSIEIEVKVSASDLRRELEVKDTKHRFLAGEFGENFWAPNRFFFLVPERLAVEAVKIVEDKAPRYGVLSYRVEEGYEPMAPWKFVTVSRSAKPLHERAPSEKLIESISHRMASEICGFHMSRSAYSEAFERVRALIHAGSDSPRGPSVEGVGEDS